ncbi:hypothetical protein [Mycobacterium ostraviense]|nr:hypothetical protein [Mycobacterium ostraviense]
MIVDGLLDTHIGVGDEVAVGFIGDLARVGSVGKGLRGDGGCR